jgi:hypothetical protein
MERVSPEPMSGCWLWIGSVYNTGYGRVIIRKIKKTVAAHRFVYEVLSGPIPDGLFLCHRCDVPSCVNPDHMFFGTPQENMDDKIRKGRFRNGNMGKTHCKRGHPYSGDNLRYYAKKNQWFCRACQKLAMDKFRGSVQ